MGDQHQRKDGIVEDLALLIIVQQTYKPWMPSATWT